MEMSTARHCIRGITVSYFQRETMNIHESHIEMLAAIRKRAHLKADAPVGVLGLTCKATAIEGDDRTVEFIATTNYVDLSDDVVIPSGADWTYFDLNKQVYADHWCDSEHNIGKLRSKEAFIDGGLAGWKCRIMFYKGLRHPHADDALARTVQGGQGMSIGFYPTEWGKPTPEEALAYPGAENIIRKYRVLEVSVTPMPCNVTCRSTLEQEVEKNAKDTKPPQPRRIIVV